MLDVMARWNRWGGARLPSGLPRDAAIRAEPFLRGPETVAFVGPRRSGKTTVMFQVMDRLTEQGVPATAMLHMNLEEPGLSGMLDPGLLDRLYDTFRERVHPTGLAWVFLDEVQRVPGWERWVRARTESDDVKVFVTGSSSALMSRELGTLLTGRHVEIPVFPLSFVEFLRFREIPLPEHPELAGTPARIQNALLEYLRWGGFPEIVLSDSEVRRETLLRQYFDDVLFKDVAMRHGIRDLAMLRSLAATLLSETASLTAYGRLATRLQASLDLVRSYCGYLEEAFLVTFLPFFSLKAAERQRRPHKVHAIDTGLRNVVCITGAPDLGRLAETAVCSRFVRERRHELYYWKGRFEVDLVVRSRNRVARLCQVAFDGGAALPRELRALEEALPLFAGAEATLIEGGLSGSIPSGQAAKSDVGVLPLWRFLLDS